MEIFAKVRDHQHMTEMRWRVLPRERLLKIYLTFNENGTSVLITRSRKLLVGAAMAK
jgi:hypothetical protein